MAINFPSSPTNGQVYVDSTSGNRYIYVSSYNYWKFASNGSLDLVQSGQIVFDDENIANGSNGLIFSKSANTLFANTINVSGNVSATYFTGNGALLTGIVNTVTLDPTLTGNIIATGPANTVVIKPSSSATVANTIYIDNLGQVGFGGLPFDGSYGYSTPQNKILYYGNNANSISGTFVESVYDLYNGPGVGGIYIETFYNSVAAGSIDINNNGLSIGSNSKIVLTPTGLVPNVGIGISNPAYKLDVAGSVNAAAILSSTANISSLGVGTNASGVLGEIRAANNITAYYSSDIRIKTNIVEIPNALDKINQIRGVEFDWTDEYIDSHGGEDGYFIRKHDVGVIAQEIEKVLPEVVAERNDGIKAVKYDRIVALLIEAVKELSREVKELKGK